MTSFTDFFKSYPRKSYKAGEIILSQGEVPTYAFAIKKGVVKSFNITSDGEEKPIAFDMKNEFFLVDWFFSK